MMFEIIMFVVAAAMLGCFLHYYGKYWDAKRELEEAAESKSIVTLCKENALSEIENAVAEINRLEEVVMHMETTIEIKDDEIEILNEMLKNIREGETVASTAIEIVDEAKARGGVKKRGGKKSKGRK